VGCFLLNPQVTTVQVRIMEFRGDFCHLQYLPVGCFLLNPQVTTVQVRIMECRGDFCHLQYLP
jgi:SH3-like domain-containing protein